MAGIAIKNRIDDLLNQIDIQEYLDYSEIIPICKEDLLIFSEKDPSSKNNPIYLINTYSSFYAVLCYRVAHFFLENNKIETARKISEYAKVKTGIEIHPAAKIGKNFIIDHGIGTVIGETAIIGDDCYILQSVILGASHIATNKVGVRHPQIGNNVEIGGFSTILGPIVIGDNVKIAPHSIIRVSIPSNSKIIFLEKLQIIQNESLNSIKFEGYRKRQKELSLYFNLLISIVSVFIDDEDILEKTIIKKNTVKIFFKDTKKKLLRIRFENSEEFIMRI